MATVTADNGYEYDPSDPVQVAQVAAEQEPSARDKAKAAKAAYDAIAPDDKKAAAQAAGAAASSGPSALEIQAMIKDAVTQALAAVNAERAIPTPADIAPAVEPDAEVGNA